MPRSQVHSPLTALNARLNARRFELEQATLARIHAISDPTAAPDAAYADGLRAALDAALDYGLASIECRGRNPKPVPIELLCQARLAARNRVCLDVVMRRYAAGHSLLADALIEEAPAAMVTAKDLRTALQSLVASFDRVAAAVGEEYGREANTFPQDPRQRRVGLLRRLLDGELVDTSDLNYDLSVHHLGIAASGFDAAEALRTVGERLDRYLLVAQPDECGTWAWLGGRRPFDRHEIDLLVSFRWPEQTAIACGEPGQGLADWRLTHRQAVAALPVAQRGAATFVRYVDVALLAAALRDDLLATSLRRSYLKPLEGERDGGDAMRRTLRAYFSVAGNVSSAAHVLGVNRRTVSRRLATIQDRLGHSLDGAAIEIETALRLDELKNT